MLLAVCIACYDGTPDQVAYLVDIGAVQTVIAGLHHAVDRTDPYSSNVRAPVVQACSALLKHGRGVATTMRACNTVVWLRLLQRHRDAAVRNQATALCNTYFPTHDDAGDAKRHRPEGGTGARRTSLGD